MDREFLIPYWYKSLYVSAKIFFTSLNFVLFSFVFALGILLQLYVMLYLNSLDERFFIMDPRKNQVEGIEITDHSEKSSRSLVKLH